MNYPWELVQSRLYRGIDGAMPWWHCFVASTGDGAMVVLIYVVGLTVLGRRDWFMRPQFAGYAVMVATGLSLAVIVERFALSTGRWEYRSSMPILPGFDVGLVPVLQMLLLPPLIFRLATGGSTA